MAWIYAMAGFGGGSTYIALLAASGLSLSAVPVLALICNLIVSTQGSVALLLRRQAPWTLLGPLLLSSIPAAFLGGAWRLPEGAFVLVLAVALTAAGALMLLQKRLRLLSGEQVNSPRVAVLAGAGLGLGFLAGVTGIGGGIYLAPAMHLLGWARPRAIATCSSLFIALNSLAGLVGQLTKGGRFWEEAPLTVVVGCPIAVLIGGRLGTYFLTHKLPAGYVRGMTAAVVLLVAGRLWIKAIWG